MLSLKKNIINVLRFVPFKQFFSPFYSGIGSILFMHKVIESNSKKPRISMMRANEIEANCLEEILIKLKEDYEIISLDEMYLRLINNQKHTKKFIAITFDDGYKDNLKLAYPIFKKLEIPFTIYITNCFPNHTAKLWWYMLEDIILENDKITVNHRNKNLSFLTKTKHQKDKCFNNLRTVIIHATQEENNILISQLEHKYSKSIKEYVNKEALTWEQIKLLSKDPLVSIGCHTMNHLALNTVSDTELLKEVISSKNEIEKLLKIQVHHFAYPFGTSNEINKREVDLIKSNNIFLTATTTRTGNIFSNHEQWLHALPRIQILGNQQNYSILEMYLSGLLPAIKNKLKKVVTI